MDWTVLTRSGRYERRGQGFIPVRNCDVASGDCIRRDWSLSQLDVATMTAMASFCGYCLRVSVWKADHLESDESAYQIALIGISDGKTLQEGLYRALFLLRPCLKS